MKRPNITATRLRLILSASLFVITLLAGVLFYFADKQLQTAAVATSHATIDSTASQNNVQTLQNIQKQLANDKDIIAQANSIVADSQSYQYQDQIVSDLNKYASAAGISITNIDFAAGNASGSTSTGKTGTTTTPTPTAPSGVKTTSVSVTMDNPIGYGSFLKFLRSIEDNLTKMQVQSISLSKGTGSGDQVSSDVLTIQVYVR
jgi:hypothetical protein